MFAGFVLLSFPNICCWVETLHLHVKPFSGRLTAPHFASLRLDLRGFRGRSSSLHAASTLKLLHSNWPELELWGFHGAAKKQRRISHFWKKTAQTFGTGMRMGWGDNETDGRFYERPKCANRSQAKSRKYSRGQKREENVGLFQILKKIEQLKK